MTAGDPEEPHGHCQDLRAERDPEAEREAEPPAASVADRCRQLAGADGGDDAAGDGVDGERGAGHGFGDEEYGSREGTYTILPFDYNATAQLTGHLCLRS